MKVTNRELNTILAGLRMFQASLPGGNPIDQAWVEEIATDGGRTDMLTIEEIDELCERLNSRPHRIATLYYYVEVFGGVEPEITGPFNTEEERDEEAMKVRAEQDDATDALFWLDVHEDGTAQMGAYSGEWADQAKELYGRAR